MKRDPRTDPRPGDVLTKLRVKHPEHILRRRMIRGSIKRAMRRGLVYWWESRPGKELNYRKGASIAAWRAWAKSATILTRAQEP